MADTEPNRATGPALSSRGGARSGVRLSAFIYRWVQCRIWIRPKSSRILLLTTIGYDSGMPKRMP